ncbi:MAG: PhoH family protein [Gammaproteobacteria bacterium]|nr:PhoH family protein [Gammaproteobacteria bacterium]
MPEISFQLTPADNLRLSALLGPFNEHIRHIEKRLRVEVRQSAFDFAVGGEGNQPELAKAAIEMLYRDTESSDITADHVHMTIQSVISRFESGAESSDDASNASLQIKLGRTQLECRNLRQIEYIKQIRRSDLTFGVGPAGTGKTYLAVAAAVEMLLNEQVRRLVLVRPAVEAGEKLGFLPGDMAQKVDPYLRPIYDALYEFMGFDKVAKLIERQVIEIAPLAFMRGRTLNHAAILMDEAQNTTVEQMKMFLTRIGFGSKAIVTGDVSQVDLPKHIRSGLAHALEFLPNVEGVEVTRFQAVDVVRHNLVQRIVQAYDRIEAEKRRDD